MKSITDYFITEKRFSREFNGDKSIDTNRLSKLLNNELKDNTFNVEYNGNRKISANIFNNLKEGVIGHIVEDIIASAISEMNLNDFTINLDKSLKSDVIISGVPFEIKAFNKNINVDTQTIEHGISFTKKQMENEAYPIIFVQYICDNKSMITIKNITCKYPDEVKWSKGKSGRGTVVSIN